MARRLWRDHADVDTRRRSDLTKTNVESVREHQRLPRAEVALDVIAIESRLPRVRSENHDDLGLLRCIVHSCDREPGVLCSRPTARVFAQAHYDIHPTISEIQSVRVSLAAVADDRHSSPIETSDVGVTIVEEFRHGCLNTLRQPATTVARLLRAPRCRSAAGGRQAPSPDFPSALSHTRQRL